MVPSLFSRKRSAGAHLARRVSARANRGHGTPAAADACWMENWSLQPQADGSWHITAQRGDTSPPMSIDLTVYAGETPGHRGNRRRKPEIGRPGQRLALLFLHAPENDRACCRSAAVIYRSTVHGESWFDHEWASNQLAADQVGWNWFCFQFDDQTELMLYAMRRRDGSVDPASSGTLVDRRRQYRTSCSATSSRSARCRCWHSENTGATYPVEWQISIPSHATGIHGAARVSTIRNSSCRPSAIGKVRSRRRVNGPGANSKAWDTWNSPATPVRSRAPTAVRTGGEVCAIRALSTLIADRAN